jgi:hypothetical protein
MDTCATLHLLCLNLFVHLLKLSPIITRGRRILRELIILSVLRSR